MDGIDIYDVSKSRQVLVINRLNHPKDVYHQTVQPTLGMKHYQTLRLDSEYCITLVASATRNLEPYYMSEGNSSLHHCSESLKHNINETYSHLSLQFTCK